MQTGTRTAAGGLSAGVSADLGCTGPGITCVTGGARGPGRPSAGADGVPQDEVPGPQSAWSLRRAHDEHL